MTPILDFSFPLLLVSPSDEMPPGLNNGATATALDGSTTIELC